MHQALVASMGGLPQTAGTREPQRASVPHVVLPPLAATSGVHKGQMAVCVAQGAGGAAGSCGHHGWLAPSSRCWGIVVRPNGYSHVVLALLAATNGAHQGQIAVCGPQGAGGTAGSCSHHGWLAPSSRCCGGPVPSKGAPM